MEPSGFFAGKFLPDGGWQQPKTDFAEDVSTLKLATVSQKAPLYVVFALEVEADAVAELDIDWDCRSELGTDVEESGESESMTICLVALRSRCCRISTLVEKVAPSLPTSIATVAVDAAERSVFYLGLG